MKLYLFTINQSSSNLKFELTHCHISHVLTIYLYKIDSFEITGSAFQSLGELRSAMNEESLVGSVKDHTDGHKQPKESRYDANLTRVRRNSPGRPSVVYRQPMSESVTESGPKKVSLALPGYHTSTNTKVRHPATMNRKTSTDDSSAQAPTTGAPKTVNSIDNGPKTAGNYQPDPKSYTRSSSGSNSRTQSTSADTVRRVSSVSNSGATSKVSPTTKPIHTNSFDHLMLKQTTPNSQAASEMKFAAPKIEIHINEDDEDFIDEDSYVDDQFEELRDLLKWNFEQVQKSSEEEEMKNEDEAPLELDDEVEEPITLPKIVSNTDGADNMDDDITANDVHQKFTRRVSPCDQDKLFSPHLITTTHTPSAPSIPSYSSASSSSPSSSSAYDYPLPHELPSKFRNWEDDILKELRNRFYSCCEDCKRKVMERVTYCPSSRHRDDPYRRHPILDKLAASHASGNDDQTPKLKSGDRDVARKLQELVDSLSLEQKRNLARIYSKLPKRLT